MSNPRRRRGGIALLGLLSLHALAAPAVVCAQPHHGAAAAGQVETSADSPGHGHMLVEASAESPPPVGSPATDPEHGTDGVPMNCLALAACGAPAVGAVNATSGIVPLGIVERSAQAVAFRPTTVVLLLLTPPPKS
ncbi:MAG: hypothetical protein OEO23_00965 [Gemmatimonadota bacterium]|nr:hypothetical protein [Gemmatimonadota bacterium]